MKIERDEISGAVYLHFQPDRAGERGAAYMTIPVAKTVNVDLDRDGRLFGIELLDPSGLDLSTS